MIESLNTMIFTDSETFSLALFKLMQPKSNHKKKKKKQEKCYLYPFQSHNCFFF